MEQFLEAIRYVRGWTVFQVGSTVFTVGRLVLIAVLLFAIVLATRWVRDWIVRRSSNNFVSGLIILVERPIKVGDRIEVGEVKGDVVGI